MNWSRVRLTVALASFASFASLVSFGSAPVRAQSPVVDLGTLGHDVSVAVAVNNRLQVVGWLTDNFEPFRAPFRWEDGVMRELTSGPDLLALDARDINDRGQVAGSGADVATSRFVAVVWEDGPPIRLPTPPGDVHCVAEAINQGGDVLGACATPAGDAIRWHGVLWRDGRVIDLGFVPGAGDTIPLALNDRGVVLGAFRSPEGVHGGNFVWADGVLTRLDPALFATDLNDRGQIVGSARRPEGGWTPPLILERGTIVPLTVPSDDVLCWAEAINRRGDAGGWCGPRPTVWVRGEPKLLPALSEFGTGVNDLNDRGDAVGYSTSPSPDFNARAVLWPAAAKHAPRHVER